MEPNSKWSFEADFLHLAPGVQFVVQPVSMPQSFIVLSSSLLGDGSHFVYPFTADGHWGAFTF